MFNLFKCLCLIVSFYTSCLVKTQATFIFEIAPWNVGHFKIIF